LFSIGVSAQPDEPVAHFYESLGFRRVPDSLLLAQKLADIEAALQAK
jgi:hypothetical protein